MPSQISSELEARPIVVMVYGKKRSMDVAGVQLQEIGAQDGWPRLLTAEEVAAILAIPGNDSCADCCGGPPPSWASVTFGVVLCSHAAGRHRSLGTHISRVLSLTLDKWDRGEYERMLQNGNEHVNVELEYRLPHGFNKPTESGTRFVNFAEALDVFVRSKYQERSFTRNGSGKLVESSLSGSVTTIASVEFCGVVMVKVKSARQLIALDLTTQSDPYVVAELVGGQQRVRTRAIKNCADPVWDETLMLNIRNPNVDILRLCVWDADTFSQDDAIGQCDIPLREVLRRSKENLSFSQPAVFDDQKLSGGDGHSCICIRLLQRNKPRGYISVELTYQPLD